jgi:hypothetical protein
MGNYFHGSGNGQRDFHDRNAATVDRFGREHRVVGRRHTDRGNDANLLDASTHIVLIHGFGSF